MTALQTINQGTPPAATDGDTVRTAFTKVNSNVSVLSSQVALSSATTITAAQALTTAHIGKRVNLSFGTADVLTMAVANTCAADQVTLLRNIGNTVVTLAVTAGSGDTCALSKLNPGEAALIDTDGVHAWNVLMRGRTNLDNETVNGNCSVVGSETVGGTLGVTGNATLGGTVAAAGVVTAQAGSTSNLWAEVYGSKYRAQLRCDDANGYLLSSASGGAVGTINSYRPFFWSLSTGAVTIDGTGAGVSIGSRPTFAGNTPWDSGNFTPGNYLLKTGGQLTGQLLNSYSPSAGAWTNAGLVLNPGSSGLAAIGFGTGGGTAAGVIRMQTTGVFEFVNGTGGSYVSLSCSSVTQTSDVRWKSDIETIDGAMSKLRKVRGVRYTMDGQRQVGFIAQELQGEFPELVVELDHDLGGPPDPNAKPFLGVRYQNAVAPILQGLLETDDLVMRLVARIEALEAKQ